MKIKLIISFKLPKKGEDKSKSVMVIEVMYDTPCEHDINTVYTSRYTYSFLVFTNFAKFWIRASKNDCEVTTKNGYTSLSEEFETDADPFDFFNRKINFFLRQKIN